MLGTANPIVPKRWICVKCKTQNKGIASECKTCGHEPGAGHKEGRKYTPPEDES